MSVCVGLCVNVRSTLITSISYGAYILEYLRQSVSLYGCVNVCVGVSLFTAICSGSCLYQSLPQSDHYL